MSMYSPDQAAGVCVDRDLLAKVKNCAKSDLGISLMHKNANETANLTPTHKYLPWVVVNGQQDSAITHNMLDYICDRIDPKPDGCPTRA